MKPFFSPTARQAKWMIVAGVVVVGLGIARVVTFFQHGGVVFLILGTAFVGLGVAMTVDAVRRVRRGDPTPDADADSL